MVNIIVSNKSWHKNFVGEISSKTGSDIIYVDDPLLLRREFIEKYFPQYIFFTGLILFQKKYI